jgi:hypothetical protein
MPQWQLIKYISIRVYVLIVIHGFRIILIKSINKHSKKMIKQLMYKW